MRGGLCQGGHRSLARAAGRRPPPAAARPTGLRAGVVAGSLLRAGTAALDAGSADAGIETLRRAAEEAERAEDPLLHADVLRTLGSALVHSVRGFDGEGAVVLHRALAAARAAGSQRLAADILRELAFVDVQAGRHASAAARSREASARPRLSAIRHCGAGVLAIRGMNEADLGHHDGRSRAARGSPRRPRGRRARRRQEAWSTGVMARSLLLAGQVSRPAPRPSAASSICDRERWNAFLPWPQALRAHCLAAAGQWDQARDDAEQAFALACQLGDPCWEGMAGRALALLALHDGRRGRGQRSGSPMPGGAVTGCPTVMSGCPGSSALATWRSPRASSPIWSCRWPARLYQDALRTDLPEFIAWALIYQAEAGDLAGPAAGPGDRRRGHQPRPAGQGRGAEQHARLIPGQRSRAHGDRSAVGDSVADGGGRRGELGIRADPERVVDGGERQAQRDEDGHGEDVVIGKTGVPEVRHVAAVVPFGSRAMRRAHAAIARSGALSSVVIAAEDRPRSQDRQYRPASCPMRASSRSRRRWTRRR